MDRLSVIQEVLNREDVEGLLALGAPRDEYDAEAKLILSAIESGHVSPNEEQLYEILQKIWVRVFGPLSQAQIQERQAALRRVARQIARAFPTSSAG